MAQKYHKIWNYFCGASGCLDVWEGVLTILSQELGRQRAHEDERRGGSPLTPALVAASIAAVASTVMSVARPLPQVEPSHPL